MTSKAQHAYTTAPSPRSHQPALSPAVSTAAQTTTVASILASLADPLPAELLHGHLCGLVCDICPLRAWKSPGITPVGCQAVLVAARQH